MTIQDLLISDEGMILNPYRDSIGRLTIGVGRNLDSVGISKDEALYLLQNDLKRAADIAIRFPWYFNLSQSRKNVILSMIFNLGPAGFYAFHKLILCLSISNFNQAADEMLHSQWATQIGERANRLAEMMRTG